MKTKGRMVKTILRVLLTEDVAYYGDVFDRVKRLYIFKQLNHIMRDMKKAGLVEEVGRFKVRLDREYYYRMKLSIAYPEDWFWEIMRERLNIQPVPLDNVLKNIQKGVLGLSDNWVGEFLPMATALSEMPYPNTVHIGIDLALNHTGIAILDDKKNLIFKTTINPLKGMTGLERLKYMKNTVSGIIDFVTKPAKRRILYVEGYSYGSVGRQYQIAELGGSLWVTLTDDRTVMYAIPPSHIKKVVTGNGNANKEKVKNAVLEQMNLISSELKEDESDAVASVICGMRFTTADKSRYLITDLDKFKEIPSVIE